MQVSEPDIYALHNEFSDNVLDLTYTAHKKESRALIKKTLFWHYYDQLCQLCDWPQQEPLVYYNTYSSTDIPALNLQGIPSIYVPSASLEQRKCMSLFLNEALWTLGYASKESFSYVQLILEPASEGHKLRERHTKQAYQGLGYVLNSCLAFELTVNLTDHLFASTLLDVSRYAMPNNSDIDKYRIEVVLSQHLTSVIKHDYSLHALHNSDLERFSNLPLFEPSLDLPLTNSADLLNININALGSLDMFSID